MLAFFRLIFRGLVLEIDKGLMKLFNGYCSVPFNQQPGRGNREIMIELSVYAKFIYIIS